MVPTAASAAEEPATPESVALASGTSTVIEGVSPGISDSVVRLYGAVFDRNPDRAGLEFWVDRYVSGQTLASIARSFMGAPEWTATYGEVDDKAFVDLLYENVLDRGPDSGGREVLARSPGQRPHPTAMLLGFSESPENVTRTGTVAPEAPKPPLPPPPAGSGAGRRIVYSNSGQRVWMVNQYERVVDTYPVSGRRGVPAPGVYRVIRSRRWPGPATTASR